MRVLSALVLLIAIPVKAWAQCPSSDINDVVNDPRVREALDQAWRDSLEGTDGEREAGGWIQQCQMVNVLTGDVRYYTQVLPWPLGDSESSWSFERPTQTESCRTVGSFHTHPGPPRDHPDADGFDNDRPSSDDMIGSANEGLPGIIRYGSGDDTHDFTYGYNRITEPRDPGWRCPVKGPPAHGFGDPHLQTLDGLVYDFMGIGDFVLARMQQGDVDVQARLQPYGQHPGAAVTTGIAVRDGRDRIEWRLTDANTVLVNGVSHELPTGQVLKLRSRAQIRRDDLSWVLVSSTGDRLKVDFMPESVDYAFSAAAHRRGAIGGLFGDFDGDPVNDLRAADGTVVLASVRDTPDYRQPLYARFGESWRVPADASLFSTPYAPPENVNVQTFPQPMRGVPAGDRDAAVAACRSAGVSDPALLDACVFDRTQTGSTAFLESATTADRRVREAIPLATPGPVSVDQEQGARLGGDTRSVTYSVTLSTGTFLFDARGSRGTAWQLRDSAGNDLFAGMSEMHDAPPRLAVRQGTYSLIVSLVPEFSDGRFRFRIRPSAEPTPIALPTGREVSGQIESPGQVVVYELLLDAVPYNFTPTASGDLWWSLTDPDGNEVFDANQRVFMERAEGLTPARAGRYRLTVAGRYWVGLGGYTVAVTRPQ